MIEKRFTIKSQDDLFGVVDNYSADKVCVVNGIRTEIETKWLCDVMNDLNDENEQLKIRNKGKQAFINKQDKIIKLLYNQCKDFKEILDDSNITYPIDERLNKFFEEGVKL